LAIFASVVHRLTCQRTVGISSWLTAPSSSLPLGSGQSALFGCCRHRPLDRAGSAGLLWAINGGRLVELHRDWAVVERAENGSGRIFDHRRFDVGNFRPPWIGA
jgi:hypothetical protein